MWKTILLLILTIIVLPFLAITLDTPPSSYQREILFDLIVVYLAATMLCFVLSTLTGNYSQVDKLWSLIPVAYVWIIATRSGFEPRIVLMALLVSTWGIRLTYNFSRRGGYSIRFWTGKEDYRWAVLRSKPELSDRWRWMLFNLFFISLYQMGLILLFTLPALRSIDGGPLSYFDYIIAALMIFLIIIETVADQQQWNFHKEKNRLKKEGLDLPEYYRKGFIDSGLWGLSRHPNYAAEQGIWLIFYLFSISATGAWLNWSLIGAILLVILFRGSSDFSESISAKKYPEYSTYKKNVRRFI